MSIDPRIVELSRNDATIHAWLTVAERNGMTEAQVLTEMVVTLAAEKAANIKIAVDAIARAPLPTIREFNERAHKGTG